MRVKDIQYYCSYDASYILELLGDDREYIDGMVEVTLWDSGYYLRSFFTTSLFTNNLSRLEFVWKKYRKYFCEDILHNERRLLQNGGT